MEIVFKYIKIISVFLFVSLSFIILLNLITKINIYANSVKYIAVTEDVTLDDLETEPDKSEYKTMPVDIIPDEATIAPKEPSGEYISVPLAPENALPSVPVLVPQNTESPTTETIPAPSYAIRERESKILNKTPALPMPSADFYTHTEEQTKIINDIPETTAITHTAALPETKEEEAIQETKTKEEVIIQETKTKPAAVYTDVIYKDAYGNMQHFETLDEAKSAININFLSAAQANEAAHKLKELYKTEASTVMNLINEYRLQCGLSALAYDGTLATIAMHRAAENAYANWNMTAIENGSKRHIRPDFTPASSLAEYYGISGAYGEIFGRWQLSPEQIVKDWQSSPSHNAVMLKECFTKIGVGVATDWRGGYYWIVVFN